MQTILDPQTQNYHQDSQLKDLSDWKINVDVKLPSETLAQIFEQEPLIPGIILTSNDQYLGMISRRVFFEFMSRKYSLGLFADKAIANLYNFLKPEILVIPDTTLITTATQMALERSPQLVYEPIVVAVTNGRTGVISVQQLLLAHSKIHEQTLLQLETIRQQSQYRAESLQKLQQSYALTMHQQIQQTVDRFALGITQEIKNPTNAIAASFLRSSRSSDDLLYLINLYQQSYPQAPENIQTALHRINLEKLTHDLHKVTNSAKLNIKALQNSLHLLENFCFASDMDGKLVDIHDLLEGILNLFQSQFKSHNIQIVKQYISDLPLQVPARYIHYALFYLFEYVLDHLNAQEIDEKIIKVKTQQLESTKINIHITYQLPEILPHAHISANSATDDLKLMMVNYIICKQNHGSFQQHTLDNQVQEYVIFLGNGDN